MPGHRDRNNPAGGCLACPVMAEISLSKDTRQLSPETRIQVNNENMDETNQDSAYDFALHPGLQDFGYDNTAVSLLVVFKDRDDGPWKGQA